MLKACWDCISSAPANRESTDGEQYGIRLNGDTQREPPPPPWPAPRYENEIMFILPRILQFGDKINITGQMTRNRENLTISLLTEANGSPDYGNVGCQLEVKFSEDKIHLRNIVDGVEERFDMLEVPASAIFSDPSSFYFTFTVMYIGNRGVIQVDAEGTGIGDVLLKHKVDNIRFLTVHGDVEKIDKLEFEFA